MTPIPVLSAPGFTMIRLEPMAIAQIHEAVPGGIRPQVDASAPAAITAVGAAHGYILLATERNNPVAAPASYNFNP